MRPRPKEPSESQWRAITARRKGRCDLCGRQFAQGSRIRYQPSTRRVRCIGACQSLLVPEAEPPQAEKAAPKRLRGYPIWQGEYISLFDRGDYWFRKCVVCGRDLEHAAGRVAQAKRSGVCPACEERGPAAEVERLKQVAVERDRERYRRSKA